MKNKRIVLFVSIMFVLLTALVFLLNGTGPKETDINVILESSAYAYLPKSSREYIKDAYEQTGEIILTEKNKKEGQPYLNPMYVSYLELDEEEQKKESIVPMPMIVDYMGTNKVDAVDEIPSAYDLRNVNGKNYITPVRNQGTFGLCWSFATMGSFESYLMKTNNVSYNSLTTQKFNERQLDYATSISGMKDYNSEYVSFIDRILGEGGNFYISTVALANGVSYVDYNWKKYSDTDLEKMELHQVLNYENSLYEVNSTVNMPIVDFKTTTANNSIKEQYLDTIKQHIIENGAVYVSTLWNDVCNYYDSEAGNMIVDVDASCKYYGGGHAMTIIGWDDNIEYDYCADTVRHKDELSGCTNIVSKKGAWILKNSWGTEYLNSYPYPYLTYDSFESQYHFVTGVNRMEDRIWDNNYVLGATQGISSTIVQDNLSDFYIPVNEKLELVKFLSSSEDATFKVTVTGPSGSVSEVVSAELPGLVTVDFSTSNFMVDSSSTVKISYTGGTYKYSIDNFSLFTSNVDNTGRIDLGDYESLRISDDEFRFYSETKNISSNTVLTYKFIDAFGDDVTDKVTITNNIVAENNINTLVSGLSSIAPGDCVIEVYDSNVKIGTVTFENFPMEGNGTSSDPYVIMNSAQLNQIREDLDAYYILGADIDLTDDTRKGGKLNNLPSDAYESGHGWEPIAGFSGNFDGKGHTIKGLYQRTKIYSRDGRLVSNMASGYGGLFASISGGVKIKNVELKDFDIQCHTMCGLLVGQYKNSGSPTNAWNVEISGISVRQGSISGMNYIDIGGLFGSLYGNSESNLTLNNIYVDAYIDGLNDVSEFGMLGYNISFFKNLTISNIQLHGFMQGKFDDGSDSAVMVKSLASYNINIENVLSLVQADKIGGLLCNGITITRYNDNPGSWTVKNVNMIESSGYKLFGRNDTGEYVTTQNINVVSSSDAISRFTAASTYSSWSNFSTYWEKKTVDGVARYPVLKSAGLQYTSIPDHKYVQVLNTKRYLVDYMSPSHNTANRISIKSNNEDILKVAYDGRLIPLKDGTAYVNVQNPYWDGYNRNVKITVDYQPHYTVNFEANGAEGEMESIEVNLGYSFAIPNNLFNKNYYDFMEWNTKADGSGTSYLPGDEYISSVDGEELTLYAIWRGDEFEVTFDANGGVVPISSKTLYYGDVYGELPIPYKEGYGFIGWVAESLVVHPHTTVYYADVYRTLKASWKANSYTIEFKPNGGVGYTDHMYAGLGEDETLKDNQYTRRGYTFTGWNTKADGTGTSYDDEDTINLDDVDNSLLTLYAQWEIIEYEVSFDANGGTGSMDPIVVLFEEEFEIPGYTFEKEGYLFVGWNTEADGSGTLYGERQIITVDSNITLYAIWSIKKYTITFNSNDGSGRTSTQEVEWDVVNNLVSNPFSRSGFDFVKWTTNSDGTGNSYSDKQQIRIKDNLSLYAQWKESYSYKLSSYVEKNGIIDNIPINTSISTYRSKFVLNVSYSMEIVSISSTGKINTGSKTRIYKDGKLFKEFTNVVRGDVNGDARITSADYIKIRKHIMKTEVISNNVYFSAADANQDGKVTSADYVKIRKIIMGG